MAKHSLKDAGKLAQKFFEQRQAETAGDFSVQDIEIDIEPENRIDPMLLLKTYNSPDRSVESLMPLMKAVAANTKVTFSIGETVLGQYAFNNDPNFGEMFMGKPYLLNILFDFGYGLMLGKLIVPSSVLKKQEGLPEEEQPKPAKTKT